MKVEVPYQCQIMRECGYVAQNYRTLNPPCKTTLAMNTAYFYFTFQVAAMDPYAQKSFSSLFGSRFHVIFHHGSCEAALTGGILLSKT